MGSGSPASGVKGVMPEVSHALHLVEVRVLMPDFRHPGPVTPSSVKPSSTAVRRAALKPIVDRLRAAARTGGRDYRRASVIASALSAEVRAADQLLAAGDADSAVEVLECTITLIERAFNTVDDSGGRLGDLIRRLQLDHAAACRQSTVDCAKLGGRLAKWALNSDWEVFLDSPTTHAEALGDTGLDRFEVEVDKQYRELLELSDDDQRHGDLHTFNITHLKTLLAARRGPDAVVEVMSHDLSSPFRYLRIAQVLADAGRDDDALLWLERGQQIELHGRPDCRLDDMIADLHRRAGGFEAAATIAAERFAERPSLELYQRLRDIATDAEDWPKRLATAMNQLLALPIGPPLATEPTFRTESAGHAESVKILLADGDVDGAWQAAHTGGCDSITWAKLAEARGVDHPADAMAVFQLLARRILVRTDRHAYFNGATLIVRAQKFARLAGLAGSLQCLDPRCP